MLFLVHYDIVVSLIPKEGENLFQIVLKSWVCMVVRKTILFLLALSPKK